SAGSNSKVVGGMVPTALPSSPIRTAFLGGNRWVVESAVKQVLMLHLRPRPPTQAGTTPVRRKKNSVRAVALKRNLMRNEFVGTLFFVFGCLCAPSKKCCRCLLTKFGLA